MEEFICGGYEKGTLGSGLLTKTYLLEHNWVHDSDWSLDHDDRKSASGTCVLFGNDSVVWGSRKLSVI
ncbi:hypothetical protein IC582_024250 [Cucumis melo]